MDVAGVGPSVPEAHDSNNDNDISRTDSDDTSSSYEGQDDHLTGTSINLLKLYDTAIAHLKDLLDNLARGDRSQFQPDNLQSTEEWLENAAASLVSWSLDVRLETAVSIGSIYPVQRHTIVYAFTDIVDSSRDIVRMLKAGDDFEPPDAMARAIQTLQSLTRTIQMQMATGHRQGPLQALNLLIESLALPNVTDLRSESPALESVEPELDTKQHPELDIPPHIQEQPTFSLVDSMTRTKFQYRPIRSNEIRLLHLKLCDAADHILEGTMLHSSLEDAPEFDALSRCWTYSRNTAAILLDGLYMSIEPDLHTALQTIFSSMVPVYVWVDAICVNLADRMETSIQIGLMYDVFKKAKQTHVWLGSASRFQQEAINTLTTGITEGNSEDVASTPSKYVMRTTLHYSDQDTTTQSEWHTQSQLSRSLSFSSADSLGALETLQLADLNRRPTERTLSDVTGLLQQRWFSRLLVFQEVVASRALIAHYGSKSIPWSDLEASLSQLADEMSLVNTHGKSEFQETVRRISPFVISVAHFHSKYRQVHDFRSSLHYLVIALRKMGVSHPSDRILGLLSVASDVTARLPSRPSSPVRNLQSELILGKPQMVFDRTLSTVDLYQKFMEYVMRRSRPDQALDIVCRRWLDLDQTESSVRRHEVEMPTWMAVQHTYVASSFVGTYGDRDKIYSACGPCSLRLDSLEFRKDRKSTIMIVEGFVLDRIDDKGSLFGFAYVSLEGSDLVVRHSSQSKNCFISEDELCDTLVAGRDLLGRSMPTYYPRLLRRLLQQLSDQKGLHKWYPNLNADPSQPSVAGLSRRIAQVGKQRTLIQTARGRLCLMPDSSQPDDYICILYGCSVPVVLRRYISRDSFFTRISLHIRLKLAVRKVERLRIEQLEARMRRSRALALRTIINLLIKNSLAVCSYLTIRWALRSLSGTTLGTAPKADPVASELWLSLMSTILLCLLLLVSSLLLLLPSMSLLRPSQNSDLTVGQKPTMLGPSLHTTGVTPETLSFGDLGMSLPSPAKMRSLIETAIDSIGSAGVWEAVRDVTSLALPAGVLVMLCRHGISLEIALSVFWWYLIIYDSNTKLESGIAIHRRVWPCVLKDTVPPRPSSLRVWYRSLFVEWTWDGSKLSFTIGSRITPVLGWHARPTRERKPLEETLTSLTTERHIWEYVGPCYLSGMMEGEAITQQQILHLKSQKFALR